MIQMLMGYLIFLPELFHQTFYAEEKTIKVLMEANEADIWGVEKKLRQLEYIPDDGKPSF